MTMRICWIVQTTSNKVSQALGRPSVPFGGWTGAMIEALSGCDDIELGVIMKSAVAAPERHEIDGVTHFLVPPAGPKGFDIAEPHIRGALAEFQPDLLHVEGSEFAHSLTARNAWNGPMLLSMQGIINGYEPHEYGRLSPGRMIRSLNPRKMLTGVAMLSNKALAFRPRLAAEREAIARSDALSGRTLWDRAHSRVFNGSAPYFHVPRILRPEFYAENGERNYTPHTLFAGNAAAPRKGTDVVIEALSLLRRDFPDAKLAIAGISPFDRSRGWLKTAIGYPSIVREQIERLDLADAVEFTGPLDAAAMAERMRSSHAFVLSSLIENSPNTLAEAMMLEVPVVSAFCGGSPDMARDGIDALFYRPEDPAMLAEQVRRIWEDDELARRLTASARHRALETHDPAKCRDALRAAYREILDR